LLDGELTSTANQIEVIYSYEYDSDCESNLQQQQQGTLLRVWK